MALQYGGGFYLGHMTRFRPNLSKADTWLKRTNSLGPAGVRFNQVSLYTLSALIPPALIGVNFRRWR